MDQMLPLGSLAAEHSGWEMFPLGSLAVEHSGREMFPPGSLAVQHSGFSSSATVSDLQHRTSEDCALEPSSIKYLYNE